MATYLMIGSATQTNTAVSYNDSDHASARTEEGETNELDT